MSAPVLVPPEHHGHRTASQWLLRTGLQLAPLPGAVPCARAHAQQVLWEWDRSGLSDDAGLVVTELVTNAVAASRAQSSPLVPPVRLWLASCMELVLVMVGDASERPPVYLDPGAEAGQRERAAAGTGDEQSVGWYPTIGAGIAKVVWAEWGDVTRG